MASASAASASLVDPLRESNFEALKAALAAHFSTDDVDEAEGEIRAFVESVPTGNELTRHDLYEIAP